MTLCNILYVSIALFTPTARHHITSHLISPVSSPRSRGQPVAIGSGRARSQQAGNTAYREGVERSPVCVRVCEGGGHSLGASATQKSASILSISEDIKAVCSTVNAATGTYLAVDAELHSSRCFVRVEVISCSGSAQEQVRLMLGAILPHH